MNPALQQRSGTPARPGFTLLETLLAIGLMSMIAAVLIGGSSTLLKSTVRSDPEDALRALLQTVRRTAVQKAAILELTPADNADGTGPDFLWGEENVDQDHPRTEERLPKIEGVKVQILAPETTGAILPQRAKRRDAIHHIAQPLNMRKHPRPRQPWRRACLHAAIRDHALYRPLRKSESIKAHHAHIFAGVGGMQINADNIGVNRRQLFKRVQ